MRLKNCFVKPLSLLVFLGCAGNQSQSEGVTTSPLIEADASEEVPEIPNQEDPIPAEIPPTLEDPIPAEIPPTLEDPLVKVIEPSPETPKIEPEPQPLPVPDKPVQVQIEAQEQVLDQRVEQTQKLNENLAEILVEIRKAKGLPVEDPFRAPNDMQQQQIIVVEDRRHRPLERLQDRVHAEDQDQDQDQVQE